jgi:hypothetical protein
MFSTQLPPNVPVEVLQILAILDTFAGTGIGEMPAARTVPRYGGTSALYGIVENEAGAAPGHALHH